MQNLTPPLQIKSSIKIASHFYRLFNYSEDKFGIGIIPVKDISAIVEEHSFYREDDIANNALLYVAENGCKWKVLPKEYGNYP